MAVEIERKFLVGKLPELGNAKARAIIQGYLRADRDASVRLRITDDRAWITVKGPVMGLSRAEYEYPIPLEDATEMLSLTVGSLIQKRRYTVIHARREWVIDVFEGANADLMIAEVELPDEDAALSLPPWVGREVSGDSRYLNANLCLRPYSTWEREEETPGPG